MSTRFKQWLQKYWPTFVYIISMCVVYIFLVLLFTDWFWPMAYRNGEPIIAGALSTAETRLAEKEAFQASVQFIYFKLGFFALVMYVVYCLNSLLHMEYSAHTRFAKTLRFALLGCYLSVVIKECAGTFVIAAYQNFWDMGKYALFVFSVGPGLLTLIFLLLKSAIRPKKWGAAYTYSPLIYLIFAVAVFLAFSYFDNLWLLADNLIDFFLNTSISLTVTDATRYVLRTPVDAMLPAMLLIPFFLLRSAMHNASPSANQRPRRGHVFSMTDTILGGKGVKA